MLVKPAPHPNDKNAQRKVRIPHTHALLANDGEEVPANAFWLRRIAHGDVVLADPPATPADPSATPAGEGA